MLSGGALYSVLDSNTDVVGLVTDKKTSLDLPPPGLGLITVTEPVAALEISAPKIVAVKCELLTKEVLRGPPFQYTTEPGTNPVPLTVRVKSGPPGAILVGTKG